MASPEAAAILRELQGKNGNGVRLFSSSSFPSRRFLFFLLFIFLSLLPQAEIRLCVDPLCLSFSLSQTRRASSEDKFDFESAISARFIFLTLSLFLFLSRSGSISRRMKEKKTMLQGGRGRERERDASSSTLTFFSLILSLSKQRRAWTARRKTRSGPRYRSGRSFV